MTAVAPPPVRLSDLVGMLSLVSDLGMGRPVERSRSSRERALSATVALR